jgi:hypothetical protein
MRELFPSDKASYNMTVDMDRLLNTVFAYNSFQDHTIDKSTTIHDPVFIVGSPRSGTTVLAKCLSEHPNLTAGKESIYLILLWHLYADLHQGGNSKRLVPLQEYLTGAELLTNIQQFSDRIMHSLTEKKGPNVRFVDHTPWYGALGPFIECLYPDAKFIHIIRDGRQVVRSLTKSREDGHAWAGDSIEARTKLWMLSVLRAKGIGEHDPKKYAEVRYEALCTKPEETMKKICEHLSLEYKEAMLKPLEVPVSTPSRANPEFKAHEPKRIDELIGWPEKWQDADRAAFLKVAGDLHQELEREML